MFCSNEKYNELLSRLSHANTVYKGLLDEAEEEFKKRYRNYPSDIDFDIWIDAFHVGMGSLSAERIDIIYKELNYNKLIKE